MILKHHKNLTLKRWEEFTLDKRLLMVATEFLRAKSAIVNREGEEVSHAYERALELLDLTLSTVKGNLLGELCRFREVTALAYLQKKFNLEDNQKLYKVLILLNKDAFNSLTR